MRTRRRYGRGSPISAESVELPASHSMNGAPERDEFVNVEVTGGTNGI